MKTINKMLTFLCVPIVLISLSACETKFSVESDVHEDGSVDRTLVFFTDSAGTHDNIFGIDTQNGWDVKTEALEAPEKADQTKNKITYHKKFTSVSSLNDEMDADGNTVFKIRSDIEKQFRWFYTYMKYSDTYRCINRFRLTPLNDYFTAEDLAFIDRLPAEGKRITKADSLYLLKLNEKIYDHFVMRMIFEEHFVAMMGALNQNQIAPQWMDTIKKNKEMMYLQLQKYQDDLADDFMIQLLDSLRVPVPIKVRNQDYKASLSDIEKRIDFMSRAAEAKFSHVIKMPWSVRSTNADSVQGSQVSWQPPAIKFMLKDYTMYAESRKPNYWAFVLSALVVLATLYGFSKRKRTV